MKLIPIDTYRKIDVYSHFGICVWLLSFFSIFTAANAQSDKQLLMSTSSAAVGFSSDPKLISEETIDLPLVRLLKRGVNGTVTVDLDIDREGIVERCNVLKAVDPLLDSLVRHALMHSKFAPAYVDGKAEAATVSMSFTFDLAAVVRNSRQSIADISGIVVEGESASPVCNARINLAIVDPVADADLTIPPEQYLRIISAVPGQSEQNGVLSTVTDSLGRFSFRLLPSCPVRLAIIAPKYEIAHASLDVVPGITKKLTCRLEPLQKDTVPEIVVYGTAPSQGLINIEEEQVAAGMTHFLSSLLETKTVIRTMPDSRSAMTVRAGSPFDNRYFICGVPFLAPFHFGGHPYMDIDGLMISALHDVELTIDRIAGRQLDVSGFRIDAQPGLFRRNDRNLLKRNTFSLDFSSIGQDAILSLPNRKNNDYLQLGLTHSQNTTLQLFSDMRKFKENEFGQPYSYGNATISAGSSFFAHRFESFAWLAWDTYIVDSLSSVKKIFPWGMASVVVQPEKGGYPIVRLGGSRQYFVSGKRIGVHQYCPTTFLSNGSISFLYDSMTTPLFTIAADCGIEYTDWHGTVEDRQSRPEMNYSDDTGNETAPDGNFTPRTLAFSAFGREMTLQLHGAAMRSWGGLTACIDLLGAGILDGGNPYGIVDAGASVTWRSRYVEAALHGGKITSRPDIRGLPDAHYRRKTLTGYLLSAPILVRPFHSLKFGIQPYFRKKNDEPKLDPRFQHWLPDSASPLVAYGIDLDADYRVSDWLLLNGAANLSKARRNYGSTNAPYEWDIPKTGRAGIHLIYGNENKLHIFINGIISDGLLYYDFSYRNYERRPDNRTLDISFEYRATNTGFWFMNRYDAYFKINNITYQENVSYYLWDENMVRTAVPQSFMIFEIGIRIGFRL